MAIKIEKKNNEEMVDLFEIDGVMYQIPANPRASHVLRYMRSLREHGDEYASTELLEGLLGKENYAVLENCEDLTMEDFNAVLLAAQQVVAGKVEQAAGKE